MARSEIFTVGKLPVCWVLDILNPYKPRTKRRS